MLDPMAVVDADRRNVAPGLVSLGEVMGRIRQRVDPRHDLGLGLITTDGRVLILGLVVLALRREVDERLVHDQTLVRVVRELVDDAETAAAQDRVRR